MGGSSSGGSDNDVSGNEAVYTGGKTYSSRQTKTVNKQIAATNQKNRDDRRSPIAKIASVMPIGKTLNKINNSKFVKDSNYKSRVAFAKKSGKFKNTDLESKEFVLSKGFKNQLDGMGYSDKPKDTGGNDNQKTVLASKPKKIIDTVDGKQEGVLKVKDTNVASTAPTQAEVSQAQATDMSSDQILVANKKKGRSQTILNKAKGLGDTKATIFKRTLGA